MTDSIYYSEFSIGSAKKYHRLRRLGLNESSTDGILGSNLDIDDTKNKKRPEFRTIHVIQLAIKVLPSLLIALLGLALTGSRLDSLPSSEAFSARPSLFILAPVLLNLKGCLETSLASRISTSAHMGILKTPSQILYFGTGALALLQARGMVAAALAGIFAWIMSQSRISDLFIVVGAAMVSTCLSGGLIAIGLTLLVISLKAIDQDPDLFATPLAASVGDLLSIIILSNIGEFMHRHMGISSCLSLIAALLSTLPFWIRIVQQNKHLNHVLYIGWQSVIISLGISSIGGFALEALMKPFPHLSLLAPVLNGTSHNLATVFASRFSTRLQVFDDNESKLKLDALGLTLANAVVQLVFLVLTAFFSFNEIWLHPLVVFSELSASTGAVLALLVLARVLVRELWRRKLNPDDLAFPILTGSSDLIGTCMLGISAIILRFVFGMNPFGTRGI